MTMFKGKKSSLYILGICLLMGIVVAVVYRASYNTYVAHQDYQIVELRKEEWEYIESQIIAYTLEATKKADATADSIRKDILRVYPDLSVLQKEFVETKMPPRLGEIMMAQLSGSFFLVDNDNNRTFLCDETGVLSDFAITKATHDGVTGWPERIQAHANPALAEQAVDSIISKDYHTIKYWEFWQSGQPDHILIDDMTIRALQEVFMAEGLEGLRTYEFLCPSYIEKDKDIFGVSDVSPESVRQKNNKFIVVQSFNIVEQLEHAGQLSVLKDLQIKQERVGYQKAEEQRFLQIIVIASMSFVLVMFFALSSKYNREVEQNDTRNSKL